MEKLKKCCDCQEFKPLVDFYQYTYSKTGKLRYEGRCKKCNHESAKPRLAKKKEELIQWLEEYKQTLNCSGCGLSFKEHSCLCDFHHLDPKTKKFSIANGKSLIRSITSMKLEIAKCIPLCANCHRVLHHKERQLVEN